MSDCEYGVSPDGEDAKHSALTGLHSCFTHFERMHMPTLSPTLLTFVCTEPGCTVRRLTAKSLKVHAATHAKKSAPATHKCSCGAPPFKKRAQLDKHIKNMSGAARCAPAHA